MSFPVEINIDLQVFQEYLDLHIGSEFLQMPIWNFI